MKKAIDICLIPPKDIVQNVLTWNAQAIATGSVSVQLGAEDRIPHISLLMGIADEKDLPTIIDRVKKISSQHVPIDIQATSTQNNWIHIEKTQELMTLHHILMDDVYPLLVKEYATPEMFDEPQGSFIDPDVYRWVNDFAPFSKRSYKPHITTWAPTLVLLDYHKSFVCDTLILAHLGNFNTTRTILWSNM